MNNPFIGQVTLFAGNFPPRAFAFCQGQLLPISQNTALFSIIGTIYGGDGRTTFALPDLRGRCAIHAGRGPGLSTYILGERSGLERVSLNLLQLPSHNHLATASTPSTISLSSNNAANETPGTGNIPSVSNYADGLTTEKVKTYGPPNNLVSGGAITVQPPALSNSGGSQSHENRRPFIAINYIIALFGTYPSRS